MINLNRKKLNIKSVPFRKILPNLVTLTGLIIAVGSIRFALDSRWEMAVYCILAATIIDGLDGKVARMLGTSSHFGAELDSLCDFVNFGLCPAIITYLWSLQQYEYKFFSWACIMLFIVCMVMRLARFNVDALDSSDECKNDSRFFVGMPAPSGALMALVPMILDFDIASLITDFSFRNHTLAINFYIVIIALLLVSRLPTISLKNIHIKAEYLSLSIIISVVIVITTIIYPWYVLPIIGIIYILSIPVCMYASHNSNSENDQS